MQTFALTMAEPKNNRENRVVSYPAPVIRKQIKQLAEKQQVSESKVVNQALTEFFSKTKPAT